MPLSSRLSRCGSRLNSRGSRQLAMDARYSLDLAFRGEALVEALSPELARALGPGAKPLAPALHPAFLRFCILRGKVCTNANDGLEGHGFGNHVIIIAPRVLKHLRGGFQKIADHAVIT